MNRQLSGNNAHTKIRGFIYHLRNINKISNLIFFSTCQVKDCWHNSNGKVVDRMSFLHTSGVEELWCNTFEGLVRASIKLENSHTLCYSISAITKLAYKALHKSWPRMFVLVL